MRNLYGLLFEIGIKMCFVCYNLMEQSASVVQHDAANHERGCYCEIE